jgi:ATP adenylyltransferase
VDRLWSPWRFRYVTSVDRAEAGCIFCDAQDDSHSQAALVVHRAAHCFVILNLYPYNSGHIMVVPHAHEASLTRLDPDTLADVMHQTARAEAVLRDVYSPHGLNVGINLGKAAGAGVVDHVHVHVVPRWSGDTNFMSTVADTRVLPEAIEASAARLRAAFASHEAVRS